MNDYELKSGTIVAGRYRLIECKGSGSFGEVWMAEDTELGIDVAIKIYISLDQKGQNEFKDEYKVAYGLSHENLLTTQYYSVWEHRPYLIMKYCSQGSSGNLAGNASEAQIWKFIHDVASGLKYLHAQDPPIIHQDIKPANILVDEQGNFLITDFGISKKMRTTMRKQSKRAIGSGAIAYMGPERFLADPMAVKASDIWSLGVSIYELATNELPFMGQGGGMLNAGAVIPALDSSRWSARLNEVMQACLAKETWDRPTAEALAEYSLFVLKGHDASWSQWRDNGGSFPPPSQPVPTRKKWLIPAIAVALVATVGITLAVVNSGREQRAAVEQRYASLKSMCDNNIRVGSAENYASLLEARSLLDSLDRYRSVYDYINDDPCGLAEALDAKVVEAQRAWMRSAHGQYEIAEDAGAAISYYHIAASLGANAEVDKLLNHIASQTGCEGAYMLVTGWRLSGSNLRIDYVGRDYDSRSMTLRYELTVDGAEDTAIRGEATITLESGKDQVVTIGLTDTPSPGHNHLKLINNGITFYTHDITR